jgi:hypothetical protein
MPPDTAIASPPAAAMRASAARRVITPAAVG